MTNQEQLIVLTTLIALFIGLWKCESARMLAIRILVTLTIAIALHKAVLLVEKLWRQ